MDTEDLNKLVLSFYLESEEIFHDYRGHPDDRKRLKETYSMNFQEFVSSGDGLYAMSAFNLCCANSLRIPGWLRDWLSKGFSDYFRSQLSDDLSDLGKFLGLATQTKRGQTKQYSRIQQDQVKNYMLYIVRLLVSVYKLEVGISAELAWERQKSALPSMTLTPNNSNRLRQMYAERKFSNLPILEWIETPSSHRKFLESFAEAKLGKKARHALNQKILEFGQV